MGDPRLCADIHSLIYDCGLPLRPKSALSILRIYRLVDTILALEERTASGAHLCLVGFTRVGMERLPKFRHQFAGSRWGSLFDSVKRLCRNGE